MPNSLEESSTSPSLQAELMKQKEELIQCLQEQLIGGRLRQAEMEAMIRDMRMQLHELEEVRSSHHVGTSVLLLGQFFFLLFFDLITF